MKKHVAAFIIIVLIVIGTFWFFPKSFFQQDEWAIFGNMIYTKLTNRNLLGVILPQSGLSHFTPFTRIVTRLTFDWFGLDFSPYVLMAAVFHTMNSFLLYVLVYILFGQWYIALFAALLFAANANTHQATSWLATTIGTEGCAVFLLLSLICFFLYLKKKNHMYAYGAAVSWFLSLGFKENSFFLIGLLPIYLMIRERTVHIYRNKSLVISFAIVLALYVGIRLLIAVGAPPPPGPAEAYSQPDLFVLGYRFIMLPLRSFVQAIVPIQYILFLSSQLLRLSYPQFLADGKIPDPYIVESVGADIVMLFLSLCFFVLVYFLVRRKTLVIRQAVLFCFLYVPLSVVLLILVGGRAGYASLFEPRNLYYPAIGSSVLVGLLLWELSTLVGRIFRRFRVVTIFVLLTGTVIGVNARLIRQDLRILAERSIVRKNILTSIVSVYPKLPENVIFYIESDTAYYGFAPEDTILPFQSGIGQTLLVWYYAQGERWPACFFDYNKDYLYALESQDYKGCGGRGFGYFRSYTKLLDALREHNISSEAVIAFRWVGGERRLVDETKKIREAIARDTRK